MSTDTPITDALIAQVMAEHPGETPRAMAKYFDAVHQELAPLCRRFEIENRFLREQLAMLGPRVVMDA
jgi:hypothetical protein